MANTSSEIFLLVVSVAIITFCSLGGKKLYFSFMHFAVAKKCITVAKNK